ncbi:MAG: type II toxin-antitoxin system RelE/ParE family toxin [Candidatus Woykebacteria bacterium]
MKTSWPDVSACYHSFGQTLPKEELRKEIISATKVLEENPLAGEKLSGSLSFLYSFHFNYEDVQYRVAYTIDQNEKLVIIHFADKRENFYEKLRALFK